MHRLLLRYRLELPHPGYRPELRLCGHAGADRRRADGAAAAPVTVQSRDRAAALGIYPRGYLLLVVEPHIRLFRVFRKDSFMCYPVRCATCGKTGWAGCGQHVDNVMAGVSTAQRCTCGEVPDLDYGRQTMPNGMRSSRSRSE